MSVVEKKADKRRPARYNSLMLASHQPLNQVQRIVVTSSHAGQRIDNFLSTLLRSVPKSHIYRIIRKGEVRINKGRKDVSYRLIVGDVIRVPPVRAAVKKETKAPNTKLQHTLSKAILYEDDHLIVIDKPEGMAVHGGSGISLGLIEAMRKIRSNAPFLELVHRLDRETSGCVMIAKTRLMLIHLHNCLKNNNIKKYYYALVQGKWQGGVTIEAPLHKYVLKSGERMVKVSPTGKAAKTLFEILTSYQEGTLLRVSPVTGRTHQIRVHCAYMGNPIVGDRKYGYRERTDNASMPPQDRLYLHANQLVIELPYSPYHLTITSPIPKKYEEFCQKLKLKEDCYAA